MKDIVATIGTYQKDGETKYVSRKVGVLLDTSKGPRIKLDASFNPAGCQRGDDGGVWLAIFDQRENNGQSTQPRQQAQSAPAQRKDYPEHADQFNDDDIPF